ncbi:MAG: neutral zinc metallopeptidase [Arachnia sp.]
MAGVGIGCLGAVILGPIVLIVAVLAWMGDLASELPSSTPYEPPATTPAPEEPSTPEETAPEETATQEPSPEETEEHQEEPTGRQHPELDYQNDDYSRPSPGGPEAPYPSTMQQARDWRVGAAIYSQSMLNPVRCGLDPIDVDNLSDDEILAQMDKFMTCLMRAWAPVVESAGQTLTTPHLYLITGPVDTPCGAVEQSYAGFYCTQNESIYMSIDHHQSVQNRDGWLTYTIELTLSHEFAHHIQGRTGIMWASWEVQLDTSGQAANLESRRRELQAQCFSGLAFQSLSQGLGLTENDEETIYEYEHRVADDIHGSSSHQAEWFWQGYSGQGVARCNTWKASDSEVS